MAANAVPNSNSEWQMEEEATPIRSSQGFTPPTQLAKLKQMLEADDYTGAARDASRALDVLPDLAEVAVVRGCALLSPLLDRLMAGLDRSVLDTTPVKTEDFKEAYESFRLALVMDPSNAKAAKELEKLNELLQKMNDIAAEPGMSEDELRRAELEELDAVESEARAMLDQQDMQDMGQVDPGLDVLVVGAGAAGIGTAHMLCNLFGLDSSRVLLVERGEAVGETFRRWPAEMRFISTSFNNQGWTSSFDLNSVAYGTSPAYSLHAQHPSGEQYADYLAELADAAGLRVKLRTEVLEVVPVDGSYDVRVRANGGLETTMRTRFVVWAAGEFQYPRDSGVVDGAELCVHNSRVKSWAGLPGDDFVLIGGYESGVDAAVNLAKAGKRSTLLASTPTWDVCTADPSTELAPYTAARLREVTAEGFATPPKLLAPLRVVRVEKAAPPLSGGFNVTAVWKAAESPHQAAPLRKPVVAAGTSTPVGAEGSELVVHTAHPPILCTGFEGSVASSAAHLFNLADSSDEAKGCLAGAPLLTDKDESTKMPGVFLVGPTVRHGELSFCFIYKFRQRFGVVANAIASRLGLPTAEAVERCRKMNMFLDDFSCCKDRCGEAC